MFTDRQFRMRFAVAAITVSLGASAASAATPDVGSAQAVPAGTVRIVHSFAGADGSNPQGALEYGFKISDGSLVTTIFGTTQTGGNISGDGTVFSQSTQVGAPLSTILAFAGANGATPAGGLADLTGDHHFVGPFFGVTEFGGAKGFGAIYTIGPKGTQKVLYSFTGLGDGANPVGRLLYWKGVLYGTTSAGALGYGTVFRYSVGGGLHTLHVFTGGNDGATPLAGLALRLRLGGGEAKARQATLVGRTIDARLADWQSCDGNLYGVTSNGGAAGTGTGTIFKITPNGSFTTLFTFTDTSAAPGASPQAELSTDFAGNLYGSTVTGGSSGLGEIFVLTATGTFRVIHDFALDPGSGIETTGANPLAPLTVDLNGALYGTTSSGSLYGNGNVFRIDSTGFTLKYEFAGPDGASPEGKLVDGLDGNLYGTTFNGGANGLGEIFAIGE